MINFCIMDLITTDRHNTTEENISVLRGACGCCRSKARFHQTMIQPVIMDCIKENLSIETEKMSLSQVTEASSTYSDTRLDVQQISSSEDRSKIEQTDSRNSSEVEDDNRSPESSAVVSPDRGMERGMWKSDSYLTENTWRSEDDHIADDMSVASGYTYASYDTTATSESVQDIISRLQSETDRRRRRLLRRRSSRRTNDKLQKYAEMRSPRAENSDPKLGITVEIKE